MPVYDIIRVTSCRERHAIEADSPMEALRGFMEGKAVLKDDEVIEVHSEAVYERATSRDVSEAAFVLYESEDCP